MNTMRVFLHDKLWEQDAEGFRKRIDEFLTISATPQESGRCSCSSTPAGIRIRSWARSIRRFPACTTPAGCKAPAPRVSPTPLTTRSSRLYVQGVIRAFAKDDRILGWDLWNEPDNGKAGRAARAGRHAAAAGLRLGARGGPVAAADFRRVAQRRLVSRPN